MEAGLAKLEDVWGRVSFNFVPHKEGSDVALVKMAEEDFEVRLAYRGDWSVARLYCCISPACVDHILAIACQTHPCGCLRKGPEHLMLLAPI